MKTTVWFDESHANNLSQLQNLSLGQMNWFHKKSERSTWKSGRARYIVIQ